MLPSNHLEQSICTIDRNKENVISSQRSVSVSHGSSRNSINSQRSGGTTVGGNTTTAAGTAKRLNSIHDVNKKQADGDDNFSSSVLQTVFALVSLLLFFDFIFVLFVLLFIFVFDADLLLSLIGPTISARKILIRKNFFQIPMCGLW